MRATAELYRIIRDDQAEATARSSLKQAGFTLASGLVPIWVSGNLANDLTLRSEDEWLVFMLRGVPALREHGWTVEVADDFPFHIAEADGDWEAEWTEGSGIDWLELHLGVMIDGERIDLVPALLMMIEGSDRAGVDLAELLDGHDDTLPFLVPLKDGRLLSVPLGRVRPILLALWELFTGGGLDPSEGARFTRLDAAGVAALEDSRRCRLARRRSGPRDLGRMLREAGNRIPNAVLPERFRGVLRPYQAQGVDWLQFLRAAGAGRHPGRRHGAGQDGADPGAPADRAGGRPAGPGPR